ncbi:MAG TPA: DUF1491 family protein [Sphingomicrobium sp.]|nr:DUF1491 family protein [Sphingomicrobium sp.]
MSKRLPAHVEVAAVMRRAEAEGGFATVLRKGDPDRGAVTLVLEKRGEFCGILERELGPNFDYEWVFKSPGSESMADFIVRRERLDTDFWLIELDIAEPERFIAETTSSG